MQISGTQSLFPFVPPSLPPPRADSSAKVAKGANNILKVSTARLTVTVLCICTSETSEAVGTYVRLEKVFRGLEGGTAESTVFIRVAINRATSYFDLKIVKSL